MKKLLLLVTCGLVLSSLHYVQAEETTTTANTEEASIPDKHPFSKDSYKTVFSSSYRIGKDMPAGEYKLYAHNEFANAKLFEDTSAKDFITYLSFKTFAYMKVEEGQYLKLDECFAVPVEETWPIQANNDTLIEGTYKVGVDIEPGKYKVKAIREQAFYGISTDANRNEYNNVTFFNEDNESGIEIEIKKGEYLVLEGAELSLK